MSELNFEDNKLRIKKTYFSLKDKLLEKEKNYFKEFIYRLKYICDYDLHARDKISLYGRVELLEEKMRQFCFEWTVMEKSYNMFVSSWNSIFGDVDEEEIFDDFEYLKTLKQLREELLDELLEKIEENRTELDGEEIEVEEPPFVAKDGKTIKMESQNFLITDEISNLINQVESTYNSYDFSEAKDKQLSSLDKKFIKYYFNRYENLKNKVEQLLTSEDKIKNGRYLYTLEFMADLNSMFTLLKEKNLLETPYNEEFTFIQTQARDLLNYFRDVAEDELLNIHKETINNLYTQYLDLNKRIQEEEINIEQKDEVVE